jgi:hypothetical protein
MQEMLMRNDLLDLLDEVDYGNEYGDIDDNGDGNGNEDNTTGNNELLLRIFSDDLVKLSTISDFDIVLPHYHSDGDGDSNYRMIDNSGVRELHRSLVVLAANRFPIKATLDDDQISRLLSRVLSLIQQELCLINTNINNNNNNNNNNDNTASATNQECNTNQGWSDDDYSRHHTRNQKEHQSWSRNPNDYETLQSLLSWLNREMTVEQLSRGVLLDCDEAAMALQIPLEFLNEMATSTKSGAAASSSSASSSVYAILPTQFVLSLRILVDLLLGALNSLVGVAVVAVRNGDVDINVDVDGNDTTSRSSNNHCANYMGTSSSSPLSLREWMLTSRPRHRYQHRHRGHHHGSMPAFETETNTNDHLHLLLLLRLLDRYALELVEETLDLLRPQQPKAMPMMNSNSNSNPTSSTITSEIQRQRVVKALQHAAMATNFFSIMETTHASTTMSGNATSAGTNGTSLVFVGLSRSLWRALARFIIEEIDCLNDHGNSDDDDDDTIHYWENYNGGAIGGGECEIDNVAAAAADDAEEYRVAATDVLFRLTKTQVQTILFHDRSNRKSTCETDGKNPSSSSRSSSSSSSSGGSNRRFWSTAIDPVPASAPPRLSEEEFSIVATTIVRLLGHPEDYWTAETQAWVAALLQVKGGHNRHHHHHHDDASSISNSNEDPGLDVASKLRKILQAALLCTSYVPDALPFEEQCRVQSSLKELLLLPSPTSTSTITTQPVLVSRRKRKCADDYSMTSTANDASREGVGVLVDDPWESFWSVRQ